MLIRQDDTGFYVVVNGGKYRPVIATTHTKGLKVKGYHIRYTPSADVGDELWYEEVYRTSQQGHDKLKYLIFEARRRQNANI